MLGLGNSLIKAQSIPFINLYSLDFDGTDDWLVVANQANFKFNYNTAFSVSAWIKTSASADQGIFGKTLTGSPWTGYSCFLNTAGKIYFQMISQTAAPYKIDLITTSVTANDGNWHHLVWTKTTATAASGVTIYKDTTAYTTSSGLTINTNGDTLGDNSTLTDREPLIGANDDRPGLPFNGNIDEVAVFTKALSASEISTLYGGGTPQTAGNANGVGSILGYWKIEEGSGTTVVDSSTNSNTGTFNSAPAWAAH